MGPHIGSIAVIGAVTAFFAMIVTPPDPISWIFMTIGTLLVIAIPAYLMGFFVGRRSGSNSRGSQDVSD